MTLRQKQSIFAHRIALLILFAFAKGYELTCGDFYAHDRHSPNSNHYRRLAADLHLFKDGIYLKLTPEYKVLGEFWKSLSTSDAECCWGGDFVNENGDPTPDGNHFSLEFNGFK